MNSELGKEIVIREEPAQKQIIPATKPEIKPAIKIECAVNVKEAVRKIEARINSKPMSEGDRMREMSRKAKVWDPNAYNEYNVYR